VRAGALVRRLDVLILSGQIFAVVALSSWRGTPRIGLAALVAVICLVIVRLVIEYRSGVTIRAQGSAPGVWLLVAAVPACAWWFVPRGTLTSTVAVVLVAMALAMGAAQFFKERSPRGERTNRPA
jgi:ABC-type phosphate transport system permease subunit